MKKLLRHPITQGLLGWILGGYLILIRRTTRWRHVGLEKLDIVLKTDQGAINLMWHGLIPVSLGVASTWWLKDERACLVSPSADGEFFALALEHARYPSIRGSSAKKGDSTKARQMVAVIREAMALVNRGGVLIVTPDGPRGPNEVVAPGAIQIAKRTGAPVYMSGLAVSPSRRMNTWDKVMVAAPFGQGAVVWEGPFYVPADADDAAVEALVLDWTERLRAVTRQAEVLVGAGLNP